MLDARRRLVASSPAEIFFNPNVGLALGTGPLGDLMAPVATDQSRRPPFFNAHRLTALHPLCIIHAKLAIQALNFLSIFQFIGLSPQKMRTAW